jgi:hypothetical protein
MLENTKIIENRDLGLYITVIILCLMKVIGKTTCLMEKEFCMIIKAIEIISNLFRESAKCWLLNKFD